MTMTIVNNLTIYITIATQNTLSTEIFKFYRIPIVLLLTYPPTGFFCEKRRWHDETQKPNTNCHPISWTSGKLPEFMQFKYIVFPQFSNFGQGDAGRSSYHSTSMRVLGGNRLYS